MNNSTIRKNRQTNQYRMDGNLYGYLSMLDNPELSDTERQSRIRSGVQRWNQQMSEGRDPIETCREYYQQKSQTLP
ncbi:hypothetical protein [Endozoicomonas atrinae]|uniref:hypothetical protein n=1 Tax=Endozoicomonas atrinae TaxID=1333660 RepID=UPI003B00FECF